MQEHASVPINWLQTAVSSLQWPVIVVASFWVGRYVKGLETRVNRAEANVQALIERHMPAIHKMLAEIRGLLLRGN